jgi:hypothetical protein
LARYMIKEKGYRNVKTVRGGGEAMEKYFEYYHRTHYGGKIVNPFTGKVIELRRK